MEPEESSQPMKVKSRYYTGTFEQRQLLKRLLVDGIKRGWRDANGSIRKSTQEDNTFRLGGETNVEAFEVENDVEVGDDVRSLKPYHLNKDLNFKPHDNVSGVPVLSNVRFVHRSQDSEKYTYKSTSFFLQKQAGLVLECAALHNFLRKVPDDVQTTQTTENTNQVNGEENLGIQEQDRENANIWRKTMVQAMFRDTTTS
ncbi:unnamed protein product [Cochlearia groenlandica]